PPRGRNASVCTAPTAMIATMVASLEPRPIVVAVPGDAVSSARCFAFSRERTAVPRRSSCRGRFRLRRHGGRLDDLVSPSARRVRVAVCQRRRAGGRGCRPGDDAAGLAACHRAEPRAREVLAAHRRAQYRDLDLPAPPPGPPEGGAPG